MGEEGYRRIGRVEGEERQRNMMRNRRDREDGKGERKWERTRREVGRHCHHQTTATTRESALRGDTHSLTHDIMDHIYMWFLLSQSLTLYKHYGHPTLDDVSGGIAR